MKPVFYYRFIGKICNNGAVWDKKSPSIENAIDFAHKNINEEPKQYVTGAEFSLEYLLAASGETINGRYRQNSMEEIDLRIADMVALHTTKVPCVLYRGVCELVFDQMKNNAKDMKGVDLYEKAFMSTSLVKGCELKYRHRLRIYVPKGTEAVYLGNVNKEQHFYEVVLQHGSKLKIISRDNIYINCKLL